MSILTGGLNKEALLWALPFAVSALFLVQVIEVRAQDPAPEEVQAEETAPEAEEPKKRETSGGLFGGEASFASNDEPIDIAADELVLDQEKKIATFSGNVDAVQGNLNLKSEELIIYYTQSADENSAAAEESGGRTNIRQIDARGDVRLATLTETAGGDWAIYDLEKGEITLGGKVTLTRGENILQGAKLIVDVETGNSRLLASKSGKERVRGLFIPGSEDGEKEPNDQGETGGGPSRQTDG